MTNTSSSTTLFTGYIASVVNVTALRGYAVDNLTTGAAIIVAGNQFLGDSKGGLYTYDSTSTATDDSETIVAPSVGAGRWLLSAGAGNDAAHMLFLAGVISAPTEAALAAYLTSAGNDAATNAVAARDAALAAAQTAQGAQSAAAASVVLSQTALTSAQASAAAAAGSASAASSYSLAAGVYPATYATTLPQGVTALGTAAIGTGTGGTAGTYNGTATGGPTGFAWSYTIDGTGKISAVTIVNPGLATATTAPTLAYSGGGITGATVPVAAVASLVAAGLQYWTISSDNTKLLRWSNNGTATPAAVNTGAGTQLQFAIDPTLAISTISAAVSTWVTQTPTISELGKYLANGFVTVNASWNYAKFAVTGTEVSVRASGNPNPQSFANFFNSAGTFISAAPLTAGPYVNQVLNVPNGTATIGINSRTTSAIQLDTLIPATTLGQRVQTVEGKLTLDEANLAHLSTAVSDWTAATLTITPGTYYSKSNPGAQASLTGYESALLPLTGSEGGVRITSTISGSSVAMAVYYSNADGTGYIGFQNDVTGTYQGYVLNVPANARSIGLTSRSTTLIAEIFGPVSISSVKQNSLWNGQKWTSDGDSITNFGLWQPFVFATHKMTLTNTGIGGTRLSSSGPSDTASMCTDTRIATIPADTQLLTCLPGMNDWAQNIPLGTFDNGDPTTYYGAIQTYIQKATARIPTSARLIMMTTTYGQFIQWAIRGAQSPFLNGIGLATYDYAEALRIACRAYGVPVIDTAAGTGWNRFNIASFVGTDNDANGQPYSNIHPTVVGAKRMAEIVNGRLWDIQPIA